MTMIQAPMAMILFRLVILTVVYCSMTSDATVSRTFTLKTNSTGSKLCALDKPSITIVMAASTMAGQCGVKCNVDPACELFQFKENMELCELFDYSPSNFSQIYQCTAYTATPGTQSGDLTTSLSRTANVVALAILNGQLFVTHQAVAQVSVYDTTSFQLLQQITLPSSSMYGLATSASNNYLYVSDYGNACVYRVDLSVGPTNKINVMASTAPNGPTGLSLTSVGNVLVAAGNSIKEYTPNGLLVRGITNSNAIWQAVEVNKDIWAFTVRGPMNGICTTLTNGTLIKCFTGAGTMQMNTPGSLAVGPRGYFFVADRNNNRILTVNPSLTEARQLLLLPLNTGLTLPLALSFEESRGRLYIGEDNGQTRVLVYDGIW